MNSKALVVPVILIVGVAAWLLARGGGNEPVLVGPAASGSAAVAAPGAAELAKSTLAPAASPAAVDTSHERTAALAGAPDSSRPIDAEAIIRGRVVDAKGAPRSGCELSVRTWSNTGGLELEDLPMTTTGRSRGRDGRPRFTTKADGTFSFTLSRERSAMLEVEAAELVLAPGVPSIDGKKGDQDIGDVKVLRAAVVSGIVRDQNAQPVAGVRVAVTYGGLGIGGISSATSAADGTFELGKLHAGAWTLRTASAKFLPTVREVEVAAEQRLTDVTLVVKPGDAIAGQVVDDRGVGVAGMRVGAKRKEAKAGMDIERFSADEATTTDANGYFTLAGLADKFVSVRAFGKGHSSASLAEVEVGTGNLVLAVDRLGCVEGVLQGPDGTPIAGSRVRAGGFGEEGGSVVEDVDESSMEGLRGGATTGADGSFRLENVKPGKVTVSARSTAHRPVRQSGVQVLPAQVTKGVRLLADLGAIANVRVVDEAGKPVAGAAVKVQRQSQQPAGPEDARSVVHRAEERDGEVIINGDERLGSGTTDDKGLARILGLPAGDLAITATHAAYAPSIPARVTAPKSGAVEASLTMRAPGHAEITVFGTDGTPAVGTEIEVASRSGEGEPTRTTMRSGEGGIARFSPLAPGDYEVALTRSPASSRLGNAMVFLGSGSGTIAASKQTFTVTAGETARVDLRRPVLTKLYGVVTGADGPAANCTIDLAGEDNGAFALPGFGSRSAQSGSDGSFTFEDVEPGRYVLRFGKAEQVVKAEHEVEVPAKTPELRQDLTLRTGSIRVQVAAKGTGEPVEKAEVELVRTTSSAAGGARPARRDRVMMVSMVMADNGGGDNQETTTMTMGAQRAFSDEEGVAVIEDVPIGDYTVHIKHRKHAPHELKAQSVVERQVTDCGRVELAAAGQIRGRVLDADGKPVGIAMVQSCPSGTEDWAEPTLAQGGKFRLTGLGAGKCKIRGWALGASEVAYSTPIEVDVKAGETATVDVNLPAK